MLLLLMLQTKSALSVYQIQTWSHQIGPVRIQPTEEHRERARTRPIAAAITSDRNETGGL